MPKLSKDTENKQAERMKAFREDIAKRMNISELEAADQINDLSRYAKVLRQEMLDLTSKMLMMPTVIPSVMYC